MTDPFKPIIDNLLNTFSQANLAPISLKVADKYNDATVASVLNPRSPVEEDIANIADEAFRLFDNSDKAFVDELGLGEDYSAIADEIGFEIVEGFNS